MKKVKHDPVLMKKVKMIKYILRVLSKGKMNDRFWADLSAGTVIDQKYWKTRN